MATGEQNAAHDEHRSSGEQDVLDAVLRVEQDAIEQGEREGAALGARLGRREGQYIGFLQGFLFAREAAYYRAAAAFWSQYAERRSLSSSSSSSRRRRETTTMAAAVAPAAAEEKPRLSSNAQHAIRAFAATVERLNAQVRELEEHRGGEDDDDDNNGETEAAEGEDDDGDNEEEDGAAVQQCDAHSSRSGREPDDFLSDARAAFRRLTAALNIAQRYEMSAPSGDDDELDDASHRDDAGTNGASSPGAPRPRVNPRHIIDF